MLFRSNSTVKKSLEHIAKHGIEKGIETGAEHAISHAATSGAHPNVAAPVENTLKPRV